METKVKEVEVRFAELEDRLKEKEEKSEKREREGKSKLRKGMQNESLSKGSASNISRNSALTEFSLRDLPIVFISAWQASFLRSPQTVTFDSFLAIFGKKWDLGILDPMIFSGKIRKNTKSQEKYFLGKVFRKVRKNTSKSQEKQFRKKFESQEKY